MKKPKVFISHTDRGEADQKATTAICVELRRMGIDVWLDREHEAPYATEDQKAAGPTPSNPLFTHIVSALCDCDAVIYVVSPTSFQREYVRLEFDPRILFQEFSRYHPDVDPANLPFYLALVEPLPSPPDFWSSLITSTFSGRFLNMTGAGATPLLLPTVLLNMVKDVFPEYQIPLDPTSEYIARLVVEKNTTEAPGCPSGMSASDWRKLENFFGLGPLFPGSLSLLDESQLRYGMFRIGDTAKLAQQASPHVLSLLSIWTANIMLRSRSQRIFDGRDYAVEFSLPHILLDLTHRHDPLAKAAVSLQFGYGVLSSPIELDASTAVLLLEESRSEFESMGASNLFALADLLHSRATSQSMTAEARNIIEGLGKDPFHSDLYSLYYGILDLSFPGPRLEATDEYRQAIRSIQHSMHRAANNLNVRFAKEGDEEFNPAFWEKNPLQ